MAVTSIEFPECPLAEEHIAALVAAVAAATQTIAATKMVAITSKCEPNTEKVNACAALLFADIQSNLIRAPVQVAVAGLIVELNKFLAGYGAETIKVPA